MKVVEERNKVLVRVRFGFRKMNFLFIYFHISRKLFKHKNE